MSLLYHMMIKKDNKFILSFDSVDEEWLVLFEIFEENDEFVDNVMVKESKDT